MNDRDSAFVILRRAAFREDYSVDLDGAWLERPFRSSTSGETCLVSTQSVTQIADPKARADLWVKIGRWYADHPNRLDYAIASQQQALQIDKNHKKRSPTC